MHRRGLTGWLAVAAICTSGLVFAGDAEDCQKGADDEQVVACSRLISSGNLKSKELVAALLARGEALAGQGYGDRALNDFAEVIRIDPRDINAYIRRGDVYLDQGDVARAMKDYDRALQLNPKSALAYNERGLAYRRRGEPERAIDDFNRALTLDPNFASAYNNRGLVRLDRREIDLAIGDFSAAAGADTSSALALRNRGYARLAKGDVEAAIVDFTAAIKVDPKSATGYARRAEALRQKGDSAAAIADLSEAIKLEPARASLLTDRGIELFRTGDFAGAAADFAAANKINRNIYQMLWRYLALGRAGQDGGSEELAEAAKAVGDRKWIMPVVELYLGRRSVDEMRAAATTPEHKCEAAFFAGEYYVLRKDAERARNELKAAAEVCPRGYPEGGMAASELKRIEG